MSPSSLAGLAIVVVEDHDDARRYLDLFLRQLGAEVMVASNVSEEKPFWPKVFTILSSLIALHDNSQNLVGRHR